MNLEDCRIAGFLPFPLGLRQIFSSRFFKKSGPVGIRLVDDLQKVVRQCDGCLDSHKIIIPPYEGCPSVGATVIVAMRGHLRRIGFLLWTAALCSLAQERPADLIVVEKAKRTLALSRQGTVLKTYRVALGGNPVGPKRQRGDQKTPEGKYIIDGRYAQSEFHRALQFPTQMRKIAFAQSGRESTRAMQFSYTACLPGKALLVLRIVFMIGCSAVSP